MPALHPALNENPIEFKYTGSEKLLRGLKSTKKDFEAGTEALLRRAGFGGIFAVTVSNTVKGGAHNKGLRLGAPVEPRRSVEIRWQQGSNDERFGMLLGAPHGMDVFEFHTRLDRAYKELDDDSNVKKVSGAKPHQTPAPPAPQTDELKEARARIERCMQKFCEAAPDLGLIDREQCYEILRQLGEDADPAFSAFVNAKYIVALEGSEQMFRVGFEWQEKFRDKKSDTPLSTPSVLEPKEPIPTKSQVDLLAELKGLTEKMRQAETFRSNLASVVTEIDEIENLIASKTARLEELQARRAQAEEFLTSPEFKEAEEMLAAIQNLLGSTR